MPLKLKAQTTSIVLGQYKDEYFIPYNGGKIGSSSLTNMWKNNAIALFENKESIQENTAVKVILYNADFCDIMNFIN